MKHLSNFLLLCLLLGLAQCTSGGGDQNKNTGEQADLAMAKKMYVRKNADSPEAQRDLVALDSAIKVMKTLPCENPLSWYYQGAIHAVPPQVPSDYPLCQSFATSHNLLTAWNNCTHDHAQGNVKEIPIHFLTWHRLYIYHLEKVVRKLSGYADFALPYWNYANAMDGTPGNRMMPAPLRDSAKSIFELSRFADINAGKPIEGAAVRALSLTKLFQNSVYAEFSSDFEGGLHGTIHDYVGAGNDGTNNIYNPIYGTNMQGGGIMAWVPSAGFDPVFWLHHAEVDHIWQMWTNKTNVRVTLAELQDKPWPYVFFDENGKQVTYTLDSNFIQMVYNLDYQYDDLQQAAPTTAQPMAVLQGVPHDTITHVVVGKKIEGKALQHTMAHNLAQGFVLKSQTAAEGKRVHLSLEISYTEQPRGPYEVYLNLPAKATPDHEGANFVGFINFFGSTHHPAQHGMHSAGEKHSMTFQFDVTDEMAAVNALDKSQINVTIYRSDGKTAKGLTLEHLTLTTR